VKRNYFKEDAMGVFDSIYIKCPKCDSDVEFQTKSGDCTLAEYRYIVPYELAKSIEADTERCECGEVVYPKLTDIYIKVEGR
jgi:hypothetical protein